MMWFDPTCPFTWRTSRWLRSEAAVRGEKVTWRLMSLAVLNEDRDDVPSQYREGHRRGARVLRVLAAAAEHGGNEVVDALYTELGTRVHDKAGEWDDGTIGRAVTAAGLPLGLADAADDPAWDAAVRASHEEGQGRVGQESGTPIVAFGDTPGFFGPILTAVPAGEESARLYDSIAALSAVTAFSELKRARA
ncbi:disulfide bond formation protein DsbA (plasmid) [Streptomyces sp. BB1-1-1]|uniref:mycothiol-dependent nitroreductase Rv2466c family protein n=1 Tax=unclassified Streptomyces TaxID=2593676 RepID=UPI0028780D3E|nr:disulfide bond formation protein DsbA [Streptomyces sp. BB1-1-1]WND32881.1 disulfide bond formation protein DsbA [Streptomyces sp. BB1-1-1]WND40050.1 disulfide bond formation protein DsbA [Streptomyces sp. BB1-1-1]WND40885.1 disulfide bond formation protein DsbA [Streptomyces sp. BB1-1-1]